ncbi:MAG: hypothetical protein FJ279_37980, partial [Planctomycetes bacterium]|nr:hypothetical protein [Planctomycetota bacterium]
ESRKGFSAHIKWTTPHEPRVYCLALAGQTLLAGSRNSLTAFDAADGKLVWTAETDGQVRGLAVADGRVLAATHKGAMLCFEHSTAQDQRTKDIKEDVAPPVVSVEHKALATDILKRSGKSEGYALVIGEPDSRLAEALAAQTSLRVVCVLPVAAQVEAERARLLKTGLYGSRVCVQGVEDLTRLPYAPYFADLVVVSGKAKAAAASECYRVLRPCGGALCFVGDVDKREFVKNTDIPSNEQVEGGTMIMRGPLPGAAEWRYAWADGGRSGVGKESRVRLPLDVLWFGGPGPDRLMDRHWMTSPPVSVNGRVFMTGQHQVIAFDAYNGRELWVSPIEWVGRKYSQYYSSSLVADGDSVYVIQSDRCHRLDQATGKKLGTYAIPEVVAKGTQPPVAHDYMDIGWPTVWQVIGPLPKDAPPLPPKDLTAVPERLTVKGKEYVAAPLKAANGLLDFTHLYGGYGLKPLATGEEAKPSRRKAAQPEFTASGRIAYAFARINCPKPGKLLIGAGTDWAMQWYLDGKLLFDSLE